VTLDPDVELLLRRAMEERGLSFKQAVNEAIRAGLGAPGRTARRTVFPTYDLGSRWSTSRRRSDWPESWRATSWRGGSRRAG